MMFTYLVSWHNLEKKLTFNLHSWKIQLENTAGFLFTRMRGNCKKRTETLVAVARLDKGSLKEEAGLLEE